jgi:hypothetical protein
MHQKKDQLVLLKEDVLDAEESEEELASMGLTYAGSASEILRQK